MLILATGATQAEPYRPTNHAEIVEKLPRVFFDSVKRSRGEVVGKTNTVSQGTELANAHIAAYRRSSDPRQLGYAQALLRPWWTNSVAPSEMLVARATIKQSLHDFDGALRDLDAVLTHESANAQAVLLRATILQVQGNFPEARATAARLLTLAPRPIAIAALTSVASLSGEGQKSYDLLSAALAGTPNLSTEQKVWMLTLLAEMAVRLGQVELARQHFKEALSLDSNDTYALAAYADFLIDQKECQAAIDLVKESDVDALVLRRALARRAMGTEAPEFQRDAEDLKARFAAAHLRGDSTHQREEGRFALWILDQPKTALALAQANWAVQREPADARLLLEAARATTNSAAANEVVRWMQLTKIEDRTLEALAAQFQ